MIDDIKRFVDERAVFGEPIEYNGLKCYPVLVGDSIRFTNAVDCLRIPKNETPDVEIIQMSYLEFLMVLILKNEDILEQFLTIIELCFGIKCAEEHMQDKENFAKDELLMQKLPNGDTDFYINGRDLLIQFKGRNVSLTLNGCKFTPSQFDKLRHIVLFQNLMDYDGVEMSADFKKVLNDFYKVKNRGIHQPTIEEKMADVSTNSPYTLQDIKMLPMRSFDMMFESVLRKIDYMANKSLEPHLKSGSIEHWVYYHDKGKYSDVFSDANDVAKKVTSV